MIHVTEGALLSWALGHRGYQRFGKGRTADLLEVADRAVGVAPDAAGEALVGGAEGDSGVQAGPAALRRPVEMDGQPRLGNIQAVGAAVRRCRWRCRRG
ncbi:hypothetical protein ACRJ4W_09650 [Streptomyces sp. GLT-R25]